MIAHAFRSRVADTREWVKVYRSLGFQPLPSRMDAKRPFCRFADWWERPAPLDSLWGRFETTNIQLMLGRAWNLAVIDLDGPEAIAEWERWMSLRPLPPTWESTSGGNGRHVWFSLPAGLGPLGKAKLWGVWQPDVNDGKGGWKPHSAIELLCDRSLVMAPPSVHPTTGRVYRWRGGRTPFKIARPVELPTWLLKLPRLEAPRPEAPPPPTVPMKAVHRPRGVRWDSKDVLHAILDKTALAESWGLRIASRRENAAGWMPCHAIDRPDRNPSASFSASKGGRYWEPGQRSIGLFELAVRLGVYASWHDAVHDLATRYGVKPPRPRYHRPMSVA